MAVIRIKNKVDGGGIPSGLTQGELAVNLTDRSLYVGGTVANTSIYLSGVQSFNGATGAVTGASLGANTFTGLNQFQAGISAAGATLGTLVVIDGISANGGVTFSRFRAGKVGFGSNDMLIVEPGAVIVNGSFIANDEATILKGISASGATLGTLTVHRGISASGGATFNGSISAVGGITTANLYVSTGATFASTLQVNGGFSAANTSTFGGLAYFNSGISASGATLGTLTVHNGISANGGATFSGLVHAVSGISAAGATLGTLIVHRGISASGGVTFQNNLYVGGNISLEGDVSLVDESGSYFVEFVRSVGTTSDLPAVGTAGQIFWVRGPTSGVYVQNYSGYYFWDDFVVPNGWTGDPAQISAKWVRLTNATQYDVNDLNQDGIINGSDLGTILAAWGSQGYSGGNFAVALTNGSQNAFEVKIFGVTTGKKASAFRITSDVTDPQIFMKAGTVDVDGNLVVKDLTSGIDSVLRVEGSRFSSAPLLRVVGAEGITGGYSIFQCGVVFDGGTANGMTFGSPVYMGATLTMNSNIRFNSGYGITGGFIDAGWY